jgi:hypothetical protein
MTAADWEGCTYPGSMLAHLRTGSARKLRLFVRASIRHIWPLLPDPRSRRAVEAAELWADGFLSARDLRKARATAFEAEGERGEANYYAVRAATRVTIPRKDWVVYTARCASMAVASRQDEERHQCGLLRDIFGNPFRPLPALDPAWLAWNEGIVRRLAEAAYQDRLLPDGTLDAGRLEVLADALEEAGCDNEEILSHLRQQEIIHYRGCWVVDLLLNKV